MVARGCPEKTFYVTSIGCGLAGCLPEEIAPMFEFAPPNVVLPGVFMDVLNDVPQLY
jgi:hypothetical protein